MIVSEDRLKKSLTYLAETDETCANAKALFDGLKEQTKTIYGVEYLQVKEGSVEEKKSFAFTSEQYKNHLMKIQDAHANFELQRNKRSTESLMVEVWRSENANRRSGNI